MELQFHALSRCSWSGGGFWDTAETLKWWCKAASQGQKEATAAILHVDGDCADVSKASSQDMPLTTLTPRDTRTAN
jgi:hypothetical protein